MKEKSSMAAAQHKPDLSSCASEPIHVPGAIQPYGVLIATESDTWRIEWVSANIEHCLGVAALHAIGLELAQLIGEQACAAIESTLNGDSYGVSNLLYLTLPISLKPERAVLVHRHLGRIIIELEQSAPLESRTLALSRTQSIIASLRESETVAQLCNEAVRQIRLLTNYDRVMVYRFDPDGHGQIIAEAKAPTVTSSYLDLRYPASDIPEQARRLYLLQRVRYIQRVDYLAVPMLSALFPAGLPDAKPAALDMTYCSTRAVSPVHLDYLRNMGVSATLTLSLIQDNQLWGMVVCHHRSPHSVSAETRAFCDVVGQLISVLLRKVISVEELAGQLADQHVLNTLQEDIAALGEVTAGLCEHPEALLALMQAEGAWVRCDGKTRLLGRTPPEEAILALIADIAGRQGEPITALADAGRPEGPGAAYSAVASGILVLPLLNKPGDGIAWIRPEVIQTVSWAGDPLKPVELAGGDQRISPRTSFAAWTELVRGRSAAWTTANLRAAQELTRLITAALLREAEARLAQLSLVDPLTGLANRRMIDKEVERWQNSDTDKPAAVLLLDFDRFKTINDSLGHLAGDQILIQFATRLRMGAPLGSIAGRLGGDEFVLFWPGATSSKAQQLAMALAQTFTEPFLLQDRRYHASTSIGVACSGRSGAQDLMRRADVAMYAAKRQGGGRALMFRPELYPSTLDRVQIEQDLFRALENDEFEIHYQPQVRIADRSICGLEALLRWRHPVRGWIAPSTFIPAAEDSGLITRIGAWMLAGTIQQAADWSDTFPGLTISVNVSPRQLTDGSLSTFLLATLKRYPSAAHRLGIEVTEGVLMNESAVQELHRLRTLDLQVSVDDFGTGYSSLSYLRGLPVDTVKIDRSFVAALGSSAKADRFFKAIVDLAHTLDLHTIAEGCETEDQWRIIAAAGCEQVQGWLVAHAMPAAETSAFLKARAR
jgi:diguanylate cyclase (GGDEF)-like protein